MRTRARRGPVSIAGFAEYKHVTYQRAGREQKFSNRF